MDGDQWRTGLTPFLDPRPGKSIQKYGPTIEAARGQDRKPSSEIAAKEFVLRSCVLLDRPYRFMGHFRHSSVVPTPGSKLRRCQDNGHGVVRGSVEFAAAGFRGSAAPLFEEERHTRRTALVA